MPKEESLPTRKKMRKGTHSCFECTFVRLCFCNRSLLHSALFSFVYILSITIASPLFRTCCFFFLAISDPPQVVAARSDASISPTTRMCARSASPEAVVALIRRVPIQRSLSTIGRTFVNEFHD